MMTLVHDQTCDCDRHGANLHTIFKKT